ncbi:hypothetical protein GNI_196360 [Gregarina niphandrodes]|uniref:Uncharacterized protein n=1 Tax=Gregarina niphandrodes TaxID=110365 RepID=A0A023AWA0_GRENI|nr:hypothetical protein GNI_196360 [Gregarina niphandrodes]EZG43016.1 hypothetical protein GNI_196360 [Gregarina niphandrodes]|eukprot:XP_011133710.1 hypothetical protein GNI_196360 [Gregarina niphandrodes]
MVLRWALALSRFNFTLEFLSGEKNNMADWLSRYVAEDEECDAEIEAMALGGRVIGYVGQLLGSSQVSEEDFMREYRQLEPQGVPGVKKDGMWWRQAMTGKVYVPEAKVVR